MDSDGSRTNERSYAISRAAILHNVTPISSYSGYFCCVDVVRMIQMHCRHYQASSRALVSQLLRAVCNTTLLHVSEAWTKYTDTGALLRLVRPMHLLCH